MQKKGITKDDGAKKDTKKVDKPVKLTKDGEAAPKVKVDFSKPKAKPMKSRG